MVHPSRSCLKSFPCTGQVSLCQECLRLLLEDDEVGRREGEATILGFVRLRVSAHPVQDSRESSHDRAGPVIQSLTLAGSRERLFPPSEAVLGLRHQTERGGLLG